MFATVVQITYCLNIDIYEVYTDVSDAHEYNTS